MASAASGLPPGQTARSVRRSCIVAAKEAGLSADGEAGLAQIMGNSARQWQKAYDVRLRDRREEQGRVAWTAVVAGASAGAGAGAAPSASEEEEEEAEAEGGGGRELALVPPPAKRQRNERLDRMLAEKAAKKAAIEARKQAIKTFALATIAAVKRERGRPCGWTLRADAPELLSAEEFDQLTTKQLQEIFSDYYEGGSDSTECKTGNRKYLRRKLVLHAAESSTMTSGAASV